MATREVGDPRGAIVRLCRYAVPLVLAWVAWATRGEIAAVLGGLDVETVLAAALDRFVTLDWQGLALVLGFVHAFVAAVAVIRGHVTWSPERIALATREESRRLGRTSALLLLPAIWDLATLAMGMVRGFRLRDRVTLQDVSALADEVMAQQDETAVAQRSLRERLGMLDGRSEDFEERLSGLERGLGVHVEEPVRVRASGERAAVVDSTRDSI